MAFNSLLFGVFMAIFFAMFHGVCRTTRQKTVLLLLASLVFYASWSWKYLPILLLTALTDFFLAKKISDSKNDSNRRLLLILSLILNIGMLSFFKYFNFFMSAFSSTFVPWKILVPLGISFYTFQSMAYVMDVYYRRVEARRHPLHFLTAVIFFPHLMAGPLIRIQTLFSQFETIIKPQTKDLFLGLFLFTVGLMKKTVADMLGTYVDKVFKSGASGAHEAWGASLGFLGQMYGDFSGYTDMAIGAALLIGIHLPRNFYLPFFSASPTDYYTNRWHISLAGWIKDYLFTPLALKFSRIHPKLISVATILTMTIMGLWHGANYTFIIWGVYVGVLVIIFYAMENHYIRLPLFMRVILTQFLVMIGLIVFRAQTLSEAGNMIGSLFGTWTNIDYLSLMLVLIGLISLILLSLLSDLYQDYVSSNLKLWMLLTTLFITLSMTFGGGNDSFIYFQF